PGVPERRQRASPPVREGDPGLANLEALIVVLPHVDPADLLPGIGTTAPPDAPADGDSGRPDLGPAPDGYADAQSKRHGRQAREPAESDEARWMDDPSRDEQQSDDQEERLGRAIPILPTEHQFVHDSMLRLSALSGELFTS